MSKTKIFAVTGNPVLQSRSPDIFNAAFELLSMDAVYTRFAASRPEEIIEGALDIGISGFNVTSPFKEEIVPFLDDMEEAAQRIGAVNTIIVKEGRLKGFNTDIKGVKDALHFNGVKAEGKRAFVLGAGGAAKAAVCALISEGADVVIANRTFEKARAISEELGCKVARMEHIDETLKHTDILVSCLSSKERVVKPDALKKGIVILDANYGVPTALVKDGKQRGCTIVDGREWLLFQGISAFRHFTGIEPPMEVMRKAVYRESMSCKKNIAFIGFMGAGKSTVGHGVSKQSAMSYIDIDEEIKQKTGLSIREIFEVKREGAFRQIEKKEIACIPDLSNTVISCGGGAILNRANRDILRKSCIVVWLWANIDTVLKKVGNDNGRPLLPEAHTESGIRRMLNERLPLYASTSDMIVKTDGVEPNEIIRKIYDETGKVLTN
ncbi:MAG: shikimate dehydrogenase [Proteobacteria bacterium]|nr:shikimate dehydrogenase [Pseudomonadota bacterium]